MNGEVIFEEQSQDITGKEIEYLYVCTRKLWLYHHGIRMELENENVLIGMQIDESSYQREQKHIAIGNAGVVDRIDFANGIIYETKKGGAVKEATKAQVRYYMSELRRRGIEIEKAIVSYPNKRQKTEVSWGPSMEAEAAEDVREVKRIVAQKQPPAIPKSVSFCTKCAFFDFCYS